MGFVALRRMHGQDIGFVALRRMHGGGDRMIARAGGRTSDLQTFSDLRLAVTLFDAATLESEREKRQPASTQPVWYENLSGVVSCPENSNINTDGLDSVVIGSPD